MSDAIAIIIAVATNLTVVAFGYGLLHQRVKDVERRTTENAARIEENRRLTSITMDAALLHNQDTFLKLTSGMSKIEGKVDMLISMAKKQGC